MGQALRIQEDAVVAEHASVKYRSREVPGDWYVDPADPEAADRYNQNVQQSLEDQATALLAAHEALIGDLPAGAGRRLGRPSHGVASSPGNSRTAGVDRTAGPK
ncbi:hypothetical protein StoSoilB13_36030 (plasmid) [Arthrobacter sp. StoSoilB13]|nr:hypothetical protein StoSoilB13_36030 [Arthrobacter sp. StoSoilB13]